MSEQTQIPDYDGGLNQLLADAREQIVAHADNETWGIDRAIKAMRNTRAAATCLVAEINCFQQERAVLYDTIAGVLPPPPIQLHDEREAIANIAPPEPRPDKQAEIERLADMFRPPVRRSA